MLVIVVEFEVRAEFAADFLERVKQQAGDTLELENDCAVFDVCLDPANTCRILLYEVYLNRAAFDAHLQSAHFLAFNAAVKSWVVNKKIREFERL